ncbi:MAG TPA: SDR family oxidoreductase [bacterium]|nr:SDR family oxidoreductase [bacterium]
MLRTYKDSVALLTGGGSGLGVAMAKELLARGAARVVLADVRPEAAAAAAKELGDRATAATLDVRDLTAFRALVDDVAKREGRIDYFFNNAGTGTFGTAERHLPEDWKLVLDVNLYGVVNGVQAAYPVMMRQGFGHIVNTASIAGLLPTPLLIAYTTSKHAVVGLSRALRLEAAHYGVRVSVLCPGPVRTPLLTGGAFGAVRTATKVPDETIQKWWKRIGPIEPDVFARVALDDVRKNRDVIVVPHSLGFGAWLFRAFPSLERTALANDLQKSRRMMPEAFAPTESRTVNIGPTPK